ncbi:MAG: DNA mismatch repair endonuclease MutL [Muribaculaceae bacterium]|nr:DNA mismatch repair endonuclease MutL [Muribaculaceae bacterium]
MSDIIRLLPDSVANQIAAGEVIQRPASVVKELVENAVDAGAKSIEIIIKDAGRTLIQVVDDGSGMSDTDARLAFERHATSKIAAAADLFSLNTMGFRGEALASIAAVARVDLRTMLHGATVGTRLIINGSVVESQEPEACTPGSNMMVKNLFFNVPARRKFLKKDSVELANIVREFERLALVNPAVEIALIHNDSVLHKLLRGSFKQRIVDLFGKSLDKQLIPVETSTSIVSISGFVSLPQFARRRNALQYLMVNGRNMRHPYFHKAVLQCYENLIPSDEQPNYFLDFKVNPASIDVNIHPTKNEIKFEDEPAIWQILVAAIKESLGRYNAAEAIDFDRIDAPEIPTFSPDGTAAHSVELDPTYNPFASQPEAPRADGGSRGASSYRHNSALRSVGSDWDKLYAEFSAETGSAAPAQGMRPSALNAAAPSEEKPDNQTLFDATAEVASAYNCIQAKGRYILTPSKSGVMVIDQHRAHLKVLYERYINMVATGQIDSQRLLFPEIVTLSPAQHAVLEAIVPVVTALGFDIAYLGDFSWSINSAPAVENNPVDTLMKIIEEETDGGDPADSAMQRRAALAMARAGAVKYGQLLTPEEMERLISDLFSLAAPNFTPDGQLIINLISTEDLAKMFA